MKFSHPFKNGTISYEVTGKGSAVVLLHGFLADKSLWENTSSDLSKTYRIFSIDLPGHGDSSSFGYLHTMEFMAEAIFQVLRFNRIRKAFLIGHSLGGYVALAFAEKYPDMVKALLLINSTAKSDTIERKKSREQLKLLFLNNKTQTLKHLIPTFFTLDNKDRKLLITKYTAMAKKCALKGIAANIEGMKQRKDREVILKFAPYPFAYLIGKKDHSLNPTLLIKETQLNPKGSFKIIENGGHMLPMEAREETTQAIKEFINHSKL